MKKFLAIFTVIAMMFGSSGMAVKAESLPVVSNEATAMEIYEEMLRDSGLLSGEAELCRNISYTDESTTAYALDVKNEKYSNIVSYIENEGELEDAYTYIARSVSTGRTDELRNTSIMGFAIWVSYSYYAPSNNGWNYPYYKHGVVEVQASSNSMNYSIGDFKCVYVSRGIRTDSEGDSSQGFTTTISRIQDTNLTRGEYHIAGSGDNGNPYYWKNSSTVPDGTAFSGIAYSFYFGGKTFTDTKILLYDEEVDFPSFPDFEWW